MQIQLNLEELRKNKLQICTPMYGGGANGLYVKSLLDLHGLLINCQIENRFSFLYNESLIPRARNQLVFEFLKTDYTHLLFIDSDIEFVAQDILAMMALDKDIITGPYPKKSIQWKTVMEGAKRGMQIPNFDPGLLETLIGDYVINFVPGTTEFSVNEPVEVMEAGTGFMMIKRDVFEVMMTDYPHIRYKPDMKQAGILPDEYAYAFFDCEIDPDSHRYLSEDYLFCQRWRRLGGKVWLCPWMQTTHVGTYGFKGNLPSIAAMTGDMNR